MRYAPFLHAAPPLQEAPADRAAPLQAPVFHFLTAWPREDLVSPLNGLRLFHGDLFDRLEASVREAAAPSARRSIAAVHLKERMTPARPPPRALVFSGPPGAAKRKVMAGLVAACPAYFARVVTHTSRLPREHEVDGVDYHFSDAPTMRCASHTLRDPEAATTPVRTPVFIRNNA